MLGVRTVFPFVLFGALAGCSVRPLPKDVSKSDTVSIVKDIRCEAKYQVIEAIKGLLKRSPSTKVQKMEPREVLLHKNLVTLQKASEEKPTYIDKYRKKRERKNISKIVQLFASSAISYSFRFEITENNLTSGNAAFRLPFTNGISNFLVGGSLQKTRLGKREFTMVENFRGLNKLKCGEKKDEFGVRNVFLPDGEVYVSKLKKRFIYPLTGPIGMDEIMDDFLRLGELGGGKGNFSDTLRFTTAAAGNIGANVTLNPGPLKKFRLANATAAAVASRTDIHEVIINLAFPNVAAFEAALRGPPIQLDAVEDLNESIEKNRLAGVAEGAKKVAAIAQCIQRAEAREDRLGVLRNIPPEVYCFNFAKKVIAISDRETLRLEGTAN